MNRLKGSYLWLLAIPLIIGLGASQRSLAQDTLPRGVVQFADVILVNGKVLTADQDFTITEAVAIRDGKIMAVGSSANGAARGPRSSSEVSGRRSAVSGQQLRVALGEQTDRLSCCR